MHPDFVKLNNYITCVELLARSVEADIQNGNKISSATVVQLSKLVAATQEVAGLLDVLDKDPNTNQKLN